jgi:hypothetical protein
MDDKVVNFTDAELARLLGALETATHARAGFCMSDEDLIAYVTDSLSKERFAQLDAHVTSCRVCSERLERLVDAAEPWMGLEGAGRLKNLQTRLETAWSQVSKPAGIDRSTLPQSPSVLVPQRGARRREAQPILRRGPWLYALAAGVVLIVGSAMLFKYQRPGSIFHPTAPRPAQAQLAEADRRRALEQGPAAETQRLHELQPKRGEPATDGTAERRPPVSLEAGPGRAAASGSKREAGITVAVTLISRVRASEPTDASKLSIPKSARSIQVSLPLEQDDYRSYDVVVSTAEGTEVDRFTERPSGVDGKGVKCVTLHLPASLFTTGDYVFGLAGVAADGQRTDLDGYYLRVLKQ